jgi:hypothetical protein
MTLTDAFTIFVLVFVFALVIFAFIVYVNEAFATFLSGVKGVNNITWGYPDNYYNNDSYPIVKDEKEHADESKDWQENGWTKLK